MREKTFGREEESRLRGSWLVISVLLILLAGNVFSGCGQQKQAMSQETSVRAMKVIERDTPIAYDYAAPIKGTNEVKVRAKVSGPIVEKYIKGGDVVQAGQALYRIDARQYEATLRSAQAQVRKARASLRDAAEDLARDQMLWQSGAVSDQTLSNQQAKVDEYQADLEDGEAQVEKAQQDLADTTVYAPVAGKLAVDDAALGSYAVAGTTDLVTIGTTGTVYAQFSISESDYLDNIASAGQDAVLQLVLANQKPYAYDGRVVAIDQGLTDSTGTLKVKAEFENPEGLLMPGMFAHVKFVGRTVPNALLVPQRAVQQLLDQSYVMVVDADGKSKTQNVTLGEKVGSYYIVKSGLSAEDTIVVEGLTNLKAGTPLSVEMVTEEEMGFSTSSSGSDAEQDP